MHFRGAAITCQPKLSLKQRIATIAIIGWRWLVISQFAVWIGGFSFYAAYVVPIGNQVLGSARAQGFITQQVTYWLNFVCAIALLCMAIESIAIALRRSKRWLKFFPLILTSLVFAALLGLLWLHGVMDGLLDPTAEIVKDEARFYQLHRGYLWLSTLQWTAGWLWLFTFFAANRERRMPDA